MKPFTPRLTAYPARTVLTITATGVPAKVFPTIMPSLYGTAYTMEFKVFKPRGKKLEIGRCISSYPKGLNVPLSKWAIVTDLEISSFVKARDLIQKIPTTPVALARRPAAIYAEILHVGSYATEQSTIKKLHEYISQEKLKIVGSHEEVYLTRPGPKAKTIIRYAIKKPSLK